MTNFKRFLIGVLTGTLLCTAIPLAGFSEISNTTLTASAIPLGGQESSYGEYLTYAEYSITEYDSPERGNLLYVAITDCDPSAVSVTIPSEIDGKAVTAIEDDAFAECTKLTEIEIPDSIVDIGVNALNDTPYFQNLKAQDPYVIINGILVDSPQRSGDVVVPEGVTNISSAAFAKARSQVWFCRTV